MRAPDRRTSPAPIRDAAPVYSTEIPVLGVRTIFRTNEPAVLETAEAAFGEWRSLGAANRRRSTVATVRIDVHDGAADPPDARVAHVRAGIRLKIRSPASSGWSDPARREARASVSRTLLENAVGFRHEVLEALTLALLTQLDRQPLHAAALVDGNAALLIAGASGAGKSTLAYAAARAGVQVTSDDMVFLQSRPHVRVWARSKRIHLMPDVAGLFPELEDIAPVRLPNGKTKLAVPTLPNTAAGAGVFDRCVICVLGERRPSAELQSIGPHAVLEALALGAESGFDVFAGTIAPVIRSIARGGAWRLYPGPTPEAAVPLVRSLLTDLSAPVPA